MIGFKVNTKLGFDRLGDLSGLFRSDLDARVKEGLNHLLTDVTNNRNPRAYDLGEGIDA